MRIFFLTLGVVTTIALAGCSAPAPAPTPTAPAAAATSATPSPTPTPTPTVEPTPNPANFTAVDPSEFFVNGTDNQVWGGWDTEDVNFSSPSGNLGCAILGAESGYLWGCAIDEHHWEFPRDSADDYCYDSMVPCGGGIEASGEELPHPRQRGDPGFPGAFVISGNDVSIRVLQYGEMVTFGNVTCYSEDFAITCENNVSGHGFVIARDRNDIY